MKSHPRFILPLLVVALCGATAIAQRATAVRDQPPQADVRSRTVVTPAPAPAPATVKAKYEGGVVGAGKSDGTLNFDEVNKRLVFRNKEQKEIVSLPYSVINAAYADTHSRRPLGATVA